MAITDGSSRLLEPPSRSKIASSLVSEDQSLIPTAKQRAHWEVIAEKSLSHHEQKEYSLNRLQQDHDKKAGFTYRPSISKRSSQLSERARSRRSDNSKDSNRISIGSKLYEDPSVKIKHRQLQREKEEEERIKRMPFAPQLGNNNTRLGSRPSLKHKINGFETHVQRAK